MDAPNIANISLVGIHHTQTIELPLKPGLNIVHGRNGTGKTTLLHTLANLLERDFERFRHLNFERITVETDRGDRLSLHPTTGAQHPLINIELNGTLIGTDQSAEADPSSVDGALAKVLGSRPVYLPAFRSILEAAYARRNYPPTPAESFAREDYTKLVHREQRLRDSNPSSLPYEYFDRGRAEGTANKTLMCRSWFGNFVPVIRYPSLRELSDELANDVNVANYLQSEIDQETVTIVFRKVLEVVLAKPSKATGEPIGDVSDEIQKRLDSLIPEGGSRDIDEIVQLLRRTPPSEVRGVVKGVLDVYLQALGSRGDRVRAAFSKIRTFTDSVNRFLEGKKLLIDMKDSRHRRSVGPGRIKSGERASSLNILSSGERQVLTLLFSATHMSSTDGVILIDEPELSLHVDWQRVILGEMMKQASGRQVIACTHAPEVAAEHRSRLIQLQPKPWASEQLNLDLGIPNLEDEV